MVSDRAMASSIIRMVFATRASSETDTAMAMAF